MKSFRDYVSGISFRSIKPNMPATPIDEFYNTKLPEDDKQMKEILLQLFRIPKMSTLALAAIINKGVSQLESQQAFVNVGVWNGFSFLSGMINNVTKRCIGIDNFCSFGSPREDFLKRFSEYKSENHYFYDMDYIDYFNRLHHGPIGFYFYDAAHDYENQLKGLQVAEPYFAKNCIIMVDDTNWIHPRKATIDFILQSKNNYEVILDVRTHYNCHPTFWNGVIILQKMN